MYELPFLLFTSRWSRTGDRGPSGLGLDRSVPSFGHAVSSDKQGLQAETWAGQDQKRFLCWPGQKLTPGTQHQQTKSVTSLDLDAPDSQVTQVSQGSLIAPAGATRGSYPVSVPHPEHLLMLAQAGPTCSLGLSMKEAGELVNWWIGARVRKETEGSLAIGLVRGWLATG